MLWPSTVMHIGGIMLILLCNLGQNHWQQLVIDVTIYRIYTIRVSTKSDICWSKEVDLSVSHLSCAKMNLKRLVHFLTLNSNETPTESTLSVNVSQVSFWNQEINRRRHIKIVGV
jgi:hypothetical protein